MPRYFARIQNGVTAEVVVSDSDTWLSDNKPGDWVEAFVDGPPGSLAGIGYIYDSEAQVFIPPQPYPSWTLSESHQWEPPVSCPGSESDYSWDEIALEWVAAPWAVQ